MYCINFYRSIFAFSFFYRVRCKAPLADLYCKRRPISFYLYSIVIVEELSLRLVEENDIKFVSIAHSKNIYGS